MVATRLANPIARHKGALVRRGWGAGRVSIPPHVHLSNPYGVVLNNQSFLGLLPLFCNGPTWWRTHQIGAVKGRNG